ncbi:MAG: hypothetical protein C4518_00200 [Desulfobacteraceae bacterium]|nr:MAG: hypothetical protein C4518_00200 [Desulfobacteraceae bacterium]
MIFYACSVKILLTRQKSNQKGGTIIITGLFVAMAIFAIMKIAYCSATNQTETILFGNDPSHEIEADQ